MTDPCKKAQELFNARGRVTVRWTRNIWHQTIKRTWDLRDPAQAKRALDQGAKMMDAHACWEKACKEWEELRENTEHAYDGCGYIAHYTATAPERMGPPLLTDYDRVQRSAGCLRYNPVIAFKITRHRK